MRYDITLYRGTCNVVNAQCAAWCLMCSDMPEKSLMKQIYMNAIGRQGFGRKYIFPLQLETPDPPGAYIYISCASHIILREHTAHQLEVITLRCHAPRDIWSAIHACLYELQCMLNKHADVVTAALQRRHRLRPDHRGIRRCPWHESASHRKPTWWKQNQQYHVSVEIKHEITVKGQLVGGADIPHNLHGSSFIAIIRPWYVSL